MFQDVPGKVFKDWKIWQIRNTSGSVIEECVKVNGKARKIK